MSETTTAPIASPECDAFLRAICTTPDDDTPRLVYADWLDDHGEHERAEFIRVQFKLLEVPECTRPNKYGKITCRCPECVLVIRWMELLGPHTTPGEYGRNDWEWFAKDLTWAAPYICTRGFVESVTCTAAHWLANADVIAWHPEQTVGCSQAGCVPVMFGPKPRRMYVLNGPDSHWTDCPQCDGTGRVARPCPPTAQPITRVTLTTELDWCVDHTGLVLRSGGVNRTCTTAKDGCWWGKRPTVIDRVLEVEWPGITFAREAVNP